jgi:hypothetical protein
VDFLGHGRIDSVEDSSVPRDGSSKASPEYSTTSGAVERAPAIPENAVPMLVNQLNPFAALALQQHGEQSTLRKGRR